MAGRPSNNPALVLCWTVDHPRAVAFVSRQLHKDRGNVSAAASSLGISRRVLHRWIRADKTLARALRAARERKDR